MEMQNLARLPGSSIAFSVPMPQNSTILKLSNCGARNRSQLDAYKAHVQPTMICPRAYGRPMYPYTCSMDFCSHNAGSFVPHGLNLRTAPGTGVAFLALVAALVGLILSEKVKKRKWQKLRESSKPEIVHCRSCFHSHSDGSRA